MSMDWLKVIADSGIPSLICLTFADRLFAEQMTEDKAYPHPHIASKIITDHMLVSPVATLLHLSNYAKFLCSMLQLYILQDFKKKFKESVGTASPDCMMCSIATSNDSILGNKEGRRRLRDAGIQGPEDIAKWILRILNKSGQCDLATKLEKCFKLGCR